MIDLEAPGVQPFVSAALKRAGLDGWMPEGEGKWSLRLQFVHVIVKGEVEYLGAEGSVARRITTAGRIAEYERHCRDNGLKPHDLTAI
jgi:hypothetical protein